MLVITRFIETPELSHENCRADGRLDVPSERGRHAAPATTMLYDHSDGEISPDEIERIVA